MKSISKLLKKKFFNDYVGGLSSRFQAYDLDFKYAHTKTPLKLSIDLCSVKDCGKLELLENGTISYQVINKSNQSILSEVCTEIEREDQFHDLLRDMVVLMRDRIGWP
ncbi:MAG: hypothetical protein OCD76_12035 [Reichenbachiella sp.]